MRTPTNILDYSRNIGVPFYAYTPDQAATIARTWIEHAWPITIDEALKLCDQLGWSNAPDDPRFFSTPVSIGERSGTISLDIDNRNVVTGIRLGLTTRCHIALISKSSTVTHRIYECYRNTLSQIYGTADNIEGMSGIYSDWTLPSYASLRLYSLGTFVSIRIHSPSETRSIALDASYEKIYGPDTPQ